MKIKETTLRFLREPAVRTVLAIIGILISIGGSITLWIGWIGSWIGITSGINYSQIPNWLLLLFILINIFMIIIIIIFGIRLHRLYQGKKHSGISYYEVWGVLWGWPPLSGGYIRDGPICPIHKISVDVIRNETRDQKTLFDFYCPGTEIGTSHKIIGPEFKQLVGSGTKSWREINLYEDVNSRIRSKFL